MSHIPVICDRCRATGRAGEDPFADLADLLTFTPVPRRPHANGWTPEFQRAFIAALATTGSAPRAARAIGKHAFGAEQLRRAKGGASFAAAWDAALDLARERELVGLAEGLAELAAEHDEERQQRRSAILPAAARAQFDSAHPEALLSIVEGPSRRGRLTKREEESAELDEQHREFLEARTRIRSRLTRGRRLYLATISDDPAKRAAWELLVGPVDWDKAVRLEPQEDEPFADPQYPCSDIQPHNFGQPGMLLTAEAGLLPDVAGGHDAMAEIWRQVAEFKSAESTEEHRLSGREPVTEIEEGEGTPEEQEAIAAYRDELRAKGWTEDSQGNLWSPDDDQ